MAGEAGFPYWSAGFTPDPTADHTLGTADDRSIVETLTPHGRDSDGVWAPDLH